MKSVKIDSANKDHVFTVENNDNLEFQSVFPEPLSDFTMGHTDLIGAYRHIISIRHTIHGASMWKIADARQVAQLLWKDLGDVPVNEDECLDEQWCHFERGTNYHDVWHWFEEEFDLSVAEDLMFRKG